MRYINLGVIIIIVHNLLLTGSDPRRAFVYKNMIESIESVVSLAHRLEINVMPQGGGAAGHPGAIDRKISPMGGAIDRY